MCPTVEMLEDAPEAAVGALAMLAGSLLAGEPQLDAPEGSLVAVDQAVAAVEGDIDAVKAEPLLGGLADLDQLLEEGASVRIAREPRAKPNVDRVARLDKDGYEPVPEQPGG